MPIHNIILAMFLCSSVSSSTITLNTLPDEVTDLRFVPALKDKRIFISICCNEGVFTISFMLMLYCMVFKNKNFLCNFLLSFRNK